MTNQAKRSYGPIEKKEEAPDPEALERGDIPMSFVDHLGEFRSRLLICVIVLLILTIGGFVFSDELLYFINKPYHGYRFEAERL